MQTLTGKTLNLRAPEPEDIDFVADVENDENFWQISTTKTPFSRFLIREYLENAHRDIYEVKQLRLIIETHAGREVGMIDLYDYDPRHHRAAIGILIAAGEDRDKGFGSEALHLLCDYCFRHLNMHQVYAGILEHNKRSQRLFENEGFECAAVLEDWNFHQGDYHNELFYQKLNDVH